MQLTDVERFVDDLGKNGSLIETVKQRATGLASIVEIGKSLDYNITLDEVRRYARLGGRQKLTSKKLDAIAGRKHGPTLIQTTALASSATDVLTNPAQLAEKFPSFAAVVVLVVIVVVVTT
ncbi:hypothetical protein QN219_32140 [Sinorhizobium sp. 7-81]|uniref:hypothetical protein n=1 Tax=unclassified Sinorhizobium TaxID=2613772 RepID=UPI0024C2D25B|nr:MULTISPECIES: hypothetical protein [unclassified Sinorhizobium]MDK1389847.1 hypothetical protein [Sinorhizobium sp. 7-81]MDK1494575.1 hypothetical protein [Sinorhizobium sp. 8-89]